MKSADPHTPPNPEQLWTNADLAQFLGCSERQTYALRKLGLPTVRVGNLVRFRPSDVHQWLADGGPDSGATDDRAEELADIAKTGDGDNAEVAEADLEREFPGSTP